MIKFVLASYSGLFRLEKTTRVRNLLQSLVPCGQALFDRSKYDADLDMISQMFCFNIKSSSFMKRLVSTRSKQLKINDLA